MGPGTQIREQLVNKRGQHTSSSADRPLRSKPIDVRYWPPRVGQGERLRALGSLTEATFEQAHRFIDSIEKQIVIELADCADKRPVK